MGLYALLCLASLILLPLLSLAWFLLRSGSGPNPFAADARRPPAPLVTDKAVRRTVVKTGTGTPAQDLQYPCGIPPITLCDPLILQWDFPNTPMGPLQYPAGTLHSPVGPPPIGPPVSLWDPQSPMGPPSRWWDLSIPPWDTQSPVGPPQCPVGSP